MTYLSLSGSGKVLHTGPGCCEDAPRTSLLEAIVSIFASLQESKTKIMTNAKVIIYLTRGRVHGILIPCLGKVIRFSLLRLAR